MHTACLYWEGSIPARPDTEDCWTKILPGNMKYYHRYFLTCRSQRYEGYTHKDERIAIVSREHIKDKDEHKDEHETSERKDVSRHDSAVQRKCMNNDIVEQDSKKSSEDIDEVYIKDDGGPRKDCLEVINSKEEGVVGEKKASTQQDHGQVHQVVLVIWWVQRV